MIKCFNLFGILKVLNACDKVANLWWLKNYWDATVYSSLTFATCSVKSKHNIFQCFFLHSTKLIWCPLCHTILLSGLIQRVIHLIWQCLDIKLVLYKFCQYDIHEYLKYVPNKLHSLLEPLTNSLTVIPVQLTVLELKDKTPCMNLCENVELSLKIAIKKVVLGRILTFPNIWPK